MTANPIPFAPNIEWVGPASDLRDIVHTLFILRTGSGSTEDMMPAYSAQLFTFIEGRGTVYFPDREPTGSGDLTLNAPMLSAAPMVLEGPVILVGASFTPLGWSMFSGLAADKVHDFALDLNTVIAADHLAPILQSLEDCRAGLITPLQYCDALQKLIRAVSRVPERVPRPDHVRLVEAIEAWLQSAFNPSVKSLYASVELGQRQVQRLCKRYYGVPPAQLVKRYRAIRAAMLLTHKDLPAEMRDEVLSAYFDQAHLIHDIRRYTGRTPKRLPHAPLAQEMLDPEGHGRTGKGLLKD